MRDLEATGGQQGLTRRGYSEHGYMHVQTLSALEKARVNFWLNTRVQNAEWKNTPM